MVFVGFGRRDGRRLSYRARLGYIAGDELVAHVCVPPPTLNGIDGCWVMGQQRWRKAGKGLSSDCDRGEILREAAERDALTKSCVLDGCGHQGRVPQLGVGRKHWVLQSLLEFPRPSLLSWRDNSSGQSGRFRDDSSADSDHDSQLESKSPNR
jgi:hypothetical protein